jgi:membrane fusion protein (multidrug efflux system)
VTDQAATAGSISQAPAESRRSKRSLIFMIIFGVAAVVAVCVGAWYLLVGRLYVSTDDAYVAATTAQITPRIDGTIASVPIHDTMHVKTGDILATIDPSDSQLAVAQAEANLKLAEQRVTQQFANVASAAAMVTQKRGDLSRAQIDYKRRNTLATTGAVSGDEMTAANNALETAQAALQQSEQQLAAQKAMIASGDVAHNPDVMAARVALDRAKLDLDRTIIRAPVDGIVAQNTAQVGQRIQAGAALMTVAPINQAYVNANFKESQLEGVHPGQEVTLTSDLYGSDVVFHGHVAGLGGGTGSAFSLIPAQNATGNWIKVVQRLPVRVALDPKELEEHPLRVGLSMMAKIRLSN